VDLLAGYDPGAFYDKLVGRGDEHRRAAAVIVTRLGSRRGLFGGSALGRLDEVQAVLVGRPTGQAVAAGLHERRDLPQRQVIAPTADLARGFFGRREAA
jgi:hypothetical protein